jgi:hypothetical protein
MEHLLLVAGPGGGGKSTFMRMVSAGTLPPELRRLLPDGVESWPQMGTDRSRRGLRKLMGAERIVLHYDIAATARREQSYAADPVLAGLKSARRLTVLEIRPSQGQLVHQLSSRTAAAEARRSRWSKLWRDSSLMYLFQLRKRLRRNRFPRKALLYERAGWLGSCYARWDAFLASVIDARGETPVVRLQPEPAEDGSPFFKLLDLPEAPRHDELAGGESEHALRG